jgi:hypothetical protein
MLHNKGITIISELKQFFTSSEKASLKIYEILGSLTLSEKRLGIESRHNNQYKNSNKLILLFLFPIFQVGNISGYTASNLYRIMSSGKDVFYRLVSNSQISWRKILYNLNKQIISKVENNKESDTTPKCLIIDDTDFHKTGRRTELIGKIFSHVTGKSILGFKGLFMGLHDGKSFFALDFSLHGEKGKNEKKPYGLSSKEIKKRYSKKRDKDSSGHKREEEYYTSKISNMINMIREAIKQGIGFDYVLVDSWFTCFELVQFIVSRRIKPHLIGMGKMGKTRYLFNNKEMTAREIIDYLRRTKKLKRSTLVKGYYSEAIVKLKTIEVKLFFHKSTHKGKWNMLLTTQTELSFEQAYKIYATRWSIEVFFKESKQYLGLGKNQSQDFDAQIAHISINILQYNVLSLAKRFTQYETMGELFRGTKAESIEMTIAERIWQIISDIANEIALFFDIDIESFMEKLFSDNQQFEKLTIYKTLMQAG